MRTSAIRKSSVHHPDQRISCRGRARVVAGVGHALGVTRPERSRLRAWAVELLLLAAAYLAVFPTLVGGQVLSHPGSWSWGAVLGYCIPVLGGVLGVVIGRRLKGEERRRAEWAASRAAWAGELPPGAAHGEWRRPVRQQANEARVVGIALVVLGVGGGAVTAIAATATSHDAAALWALATAQEIAAVALIWMCVRLARNGRRLLAES
jgi:hypothetical protein